VPIFYYVKIGLGAMLNNFLRTVLQVEHYNAIDDYLECRRWSQ